MELPSATMLTDIISSMLIVDIEDDAITVINPFDHMSLMNGLQGESLFTLSHSVEGETVIGEDSDTDFESDHLSEWSNETGDTYIDEFYNFRPRARGNLLSPLGMATEGFEISEIIITERDISTAEIIEEEVTETLGEVYISEEFQEMHNDLSEECAESNKENMPPT